MKLAANSLAGWHMNPAVLYYHAQSTLKYLAMFLNVPLSYELVQSLKSGVD